MSISFLFEGCLSRLLTDAFCIIVQLRMISQYFMILCREFNLHLLVMEHKKSRNPFIGNRYSALFGNIHDKGAIFRNLLRKRYINYL